MSWLSLRSRGGTTTRLEGALQSRPLDLGTLVLELDLGDFARARGPLLQYPGPQRAARHFFIAPMGDGRLHLSRRHGDAVSHLSVGLGREPISGRLRLSYHWDSRRGRSLLTAENLTRGTIRQQEVAVAHPLLAEEIAAILSPPDVPQVIHPAVDWLGLADHWQTIGPVPGLAADVPIDTPHGPRPVSALRPGDRVRTADAGDRLVLWQGRIRAPEVGSFRSVRLRAPYFGLTRDIVLRASQPVAVRGLEVEYLFGEEEVLAEARHLVDGQTMVWHSTGAVTVSHAILLDAPWLICAGGLWVESLNLGTVARNLDLACSTAPGILAETGRMPVHINRSRRKLMEFEAHALVRAQQARRAPLAV